MISVANFAMKGQKEAFIATVFFSALTVWLAPFGIIVGAIIALVALRIGVPEGIKTLAFAGITNMVLTTAFLGSYVPGLVSVMEYMLPVFIAAVVLRNTNSLARSLKTIVLMAGIGVISFHVLVGDTLQWWKVLFDTHLLPVLQKANVDMANIAVTEMLSMITMLIAIFVVMLWFAILLLARYWQSELYYPGRFSDDFYQLRLPKVVGLTTIIIAILGLLLSGNLLLQDLSGVLMAALMFQGLAIAHHTVNIKSLSVGWLFGLYVLLFFLPQMLLILATIGLLDIWVDFRSRWETE